MNQILLDLPISKKCPRCEKGALVVNFDGIIYAAICPEGNWLVTQAEGHNDSYQLTCGLCGHRWEEAPA